MVAGRPARGEGAAAQVSEVREDLCRRITLADKGKLVRARGASMCHRPLAARTDIDTALCGNDAIVVGETRALCVLATAKL